MLLDAVVFGDSRAVGDAEIADVFHADLCAAGEDFGIGVLYFYFAPRCLAVDLAVGVEQGCEAGGGEDDGILGVEGVDGAPGLGGDEGGVWGVEDGGEGVSEWEGEGFDCFRGGGVGEVIDFKGVRWGGCDADADGFTGEGLRFGEVSEGAGLVDRGSQLCVSNGGDGGGDGEGGDDGGDDECDGYFEEGEAELVFFSHRHRIELL